MNNNSSSKKPSLGGDAVRLTLSKVISLCITMVCTMLLSRFRTVEEYGTYSQLLLVINLFSSLFMLGLPSSINYFLARAETEQEKQKFLSVYYTLSTLLSLIMGGALALSIPLIEAYFKNPALRGFLYFLAVFPWTSVISSSVENVLVVYQKTRFLMLYRLMNSICVLGVVLVTQWMGWGFDAYMKLYLITSGAFALSVYVIVARLGNGLRISFDRHLIRDIFVFSLPLGLSSVVGTLNIEIDKLLIGFLMDTEQMAIYTNASKELPVSFVAASITAVLLPQLTRMLKKGRSKEAVSLWADATELSYLVICLLAAGVFTYAEDAMSLLYSEKYLPGLPVFRVYTLVLLLRCTYFGVILNATGRTKDILYAGIASLILNIVLNPLFYWLFGMIGPAVATFLSILLVSLWQIYRTARCAGVLFAQAFPWKRLGMITLVNVGFGVLFYGAKQILPLQQGITSLGESLLLGICWSMLYLFVMRKSVKRAWKGLNRGGVEEENS